MIHGGDVLSYKDYYKGQLVDYSSNINPLGPPDGLYENLMEGFHSLTSYPDIQYRKLKKSISNYLGCGPENVMVGNGAVEIINNFIIAAKRVLVVIPSFAEYELRALAHEKEVVYISYKEDFQIDLASLEKEMKEGDLLILGNPNNPTGFRIDQDQLLEIYQLIREKDGYLLLDEAFYEFCPQDYDSIKLFKGNDYGNLAIIRAATKFFGLPGIRLGYACTSREKLEDLRKIELPWSVNSLADLAGQFIFNDREYIERSRSYIDGERRFLFSSLKEVQGIKPYPSHTNYMLIKLEKWDEEYVFKFFLERGILIRKCSSFLGLDKNHIRIAIKDRENNSRLVKVFKELDGFIPES